MRYPTYLAFIIIALNIYGCTAVGPDYIEPEMDVPGNWHSDIETTPANASTVSQDLAQWWTMFNDPQLSELIDKAVAGNLDLRQGYARLRQARAERNAARADRFPTLDATGAVQKRWADDGTGSTRENELYSAGFDAGWELDIFGGIRRSIEASQAELEATAESLNDVLVSLAAEVAINYVDLRTAQNRLKVTQANADSQQETLDLVTALYQAGMKDELAVKQARYNLENTRAQIPDLNTSLEEALNRLAVLTGQSPGALHAGLASVAPLPEISLQPVVDVPAKTLRRRPDVRQAERELAAQSARVGVAIADLYPKFALNGAIGLSADTLNDWFDSNNRTTTLGPSFSWKIFDAGAIRANIEAQSALQEEALAAYEETILNALEEVENAITAYIQEQLKLDALNAATRAAREAEELAEYQYTVGMIDFSELLEAQRSLLSFENQQTASRGTILTNLVRLYKALGGGWRVPPATH